ncbi:HNH endonuclease family protein [Frigoriglobus tundricola]|uniref:HNH nuclease domain-containing protein n=1 Tax=Frigoriglobus tundricola TaxID=2774151 RepID=A0A6M5YKT8_9BACT|nr:hypothetical protein [Frigoriglobus tundricola]QJW94555.1 hypothetical protein FTUN_2076 [Frigoriglobus tundricola]
MIRVRRPVAGDFAPATHSSLASQHATATNFTRNDPRIESAWNNFIRTVAGQDVRRVLTTTAHTKCVFCERVNPRSVDHYYPKSRYPKRMFRLSNLLVCCWDCNTAKGSRFPHLNRRPVLIDPVRDDPAEFFEWDLATGNVFAVNDPARTPRAEFTRDQLRLNAQSLPDQRREKVVLLRAVFNLIVREPVLRPRTREAAELMLRPESEYLGIVRFWLRNLNAEDQALYDAARARLPEIDTWVEQWL